MAVATGTAALIGAGLTAGATAFGAAKSAGSVKSGIKAEENARRAALAYEKEREAREWADYQKRYSDWDATRRAIFAKFGYTHLHGAGGDGGDWFPGGGGGAPAAGAAMGGSPQMGGPQMGNPQERAAKSLADLIGKPAGVTPFDPRMLPGGLQDAMGEAALIPNPGGAALAPGVTAEPGGFTGGQEGQDIPPQSLADLGRWSDWRQYLEG